MSEDPIKVEFLCFFCGYASDETELTLSAIWQDETGERQQYWAAHRSCLIDRMSPDVRAYGDLRQRTKTWLARVFRYDARGYGVKQPSPGAQAVSQGWARVPRR